MRFEVWGLGIQGWVLGFGTGFEFCVFCFVFGFEDEGLGFRVQTLDFRVWVRNLRFRAWGVGCGVEGEGCGFRV